MSNDDPTRLLDTQQELLEEQSPKITDAVGASGVKRLRQTTCTGQYDPKTMGDAVQWNLGIHRSVPDLAGAKSAAAPAQRLLEDDGWTLDVGPGRHPGPVTTIFTAEHPENRLRLIFEYKTGGNESLLIVRGGGPCIETPEGYQMLRSHLDPSFGDGTPEYDGEAERDSPLYTPQPTYSNPGPSTEEPGPATDG